MAMVNETGPALLHCWSAELEEFNFSITHRPGKLQSHINALSRLPLTEAISYLSFSPEVTTELYTVVCPVKDILNLTVYNNTAVDSYCRLALGPLATKHVMCTLHHAGNTHLRLCKMLVKFWQHVVIDNNRVVAKQVIY